MSREPFQISIPQETLTDLQERLARTRWPDEVSGTGWDYGTNLAYQKELVQYWQTKFDWRKQEEYLNQFPQFRTTIDEFGLHFLHVRGKGPNPFPLLLTHGYPDSFYRFHKIIPLLTDPEAHGGNAADAFDVIAPSIPGYGFSDKAGERGMDPSRIANLFAKLMTEELGYTKFGAHGGDWGSSITEHLARNHPEMLFGIHLTDIPYSHIFSISEEGLSDAEKKFLAAGKKWQMGEGGYAIVQSTKPQTLAYGINDSPTGLAAWIVDAFRTWSDCGGDVESRFTKDELLTNITIYWAMETINSAFRIYYETMHSGNKLDNKRLAVPMGAAIFPKDLVPAPREFAERFFNVQRWAEMPRGGHFAALEEPVLLTEELRGFFRRLR